MAALADSPTETLEEKLVRNLMNVRRDRGRAKKSVYDDFENEVLKELQSPPPSKQASQGQPVIFSPTQGPIVIMTPSALQSKHKSQVKPHFVSSPNAQLVGSTDVNSTLYKDGESTVLYEEFSQVFQEGAPVEKDMPYPLIQAFSLHGEDIVLGKTYTGRREKAIEAYLIRLEEYKKKYGDQGFNFDEVGVTLPKDFIMDAVVAAETDSVYKGTIDDPNDYISCIHDILKSADTMENPEEAEDLILKILQNIQILNKAKILKKSLDRATDSKQKQLDLPQTYIDHAGCTIYKRVLAITHRRLHHDLQTEMREGKKVTTAGIVTVYAKDTSFPTVFFDEYKGKDHTFFWIDVLMNLYERGIRKQLSIMLTCGDVAGRPSDIPMNAQRITSFLTTSAVTIQPTGIDFSTVGQGRKAQLSHEEQDEAAAKEELLTFLREQQSEVRLEKVTEQEKTTILDELPTIKEELDESIQELHIDSDTLGKIVEQEVDPSSVTLGFGAEEKGGTRRKRHTKRKNKKTKRKKTKRKRNHSVKHYK